MTPVGDETPGPDQPTAAPVDPARAPAGGPAVPAEQVAQLRAGMVEALAELQQATDELREQSASFLSDVEAERARVRAERERAESAYAEQARDGEAGDARRELQERLDRDETTWRAVISGADEHWSAREVRTQVVGEARAEIDAIEESDPDLAARYRAHARLRRDDRTGEWHD